MSLTTCSSLGPRNQITGRLGGPGVEGPRGAFPCPCCPPQDHLSCWSSISLVLSFGAISLGFPHTSPGLTWPSRRRHVPWGCVETGALADSFTTDCSRRLLSLGQMLGGEGRFFDGGRSGRIRQRPGGVSVCSRPAGVNSNSNRGVCQGLGTP